MREGYGSRSVCVSVCVSVTMLTTTFFVEIKVSEVRLSVNVCIVWISLKMLCSKVMATFGDHLCLLRFLTSSQWTNETVMASFQVDYCIGLAIVLTIQLTHHWLQ